MFGVGSASEYLVACSGVDNRVVSAHKIDDLQSFLLLVVNRLLLSCFS